MLYAAAVYEPDDVVEIRAIAKGNSPDSRWLPAAALAEHADRLQLVNDAGWNIYVGANPRRARGLRGDESIDLARCSFVDFDNSTVDAALASVADANLPPATLVIASGHGCHAYWRLVEPTRDLAGWSELQKDLAEYLGADTSIHNPERIMRLPGFLNHKKPPPVPAYVVSCDATRRTPLAELRDAVPPRLQDDDVGIPTSSPPAPVRAADDNRVTRCRAYVMKLPESVDGEHGSDRMLTVACETLRFGLSDADALAVMREYNGAKARPPWSEKELAHKLASARKKVTGNDVGVRLREERERPIGSALQRKTNGNGHPRANVIGANEIPASKPRTGISLAQAPKSVKRERPASFVPFPIEALPEPVRGFIVNAAETIGCDVSYVALPLLASLAAAIGNTRRVRLKVGWVEACVLWCIIVGDSGSMKSPAVEIGTRALRRRQEQLFKAHDKLTADYADEMAKWKSLDRDKRGPEPEPPAPCERIVCSEATMEAVADRLATSSRGMLAARDEQASWFGGFNQYKAKGAGSDVAHWLECYGGRPLLIDRKTGERKVIRVARASVSVTGGIQPGTLRRSMTPEFFENGLCARILFACPPRTQKRWTDSEIDPESQRAVDAVFDALLKLRMEDGPDGPEPRDLPLSSEAKDVWIQFVNECGAAQFQRDRDHVIAALAKLEGAAARLALVIHQVRLAAGDPDVEECRIDLASVQAGITLSRWFAYEAERLYAALAESDEERADRALAEFIQARGGTVTPRELAQSSRRYRLDGAAHAALQALVDAGWGQWAPPVSTGTAGRPPGDCFILNPDRCANEMPDSDPASGDFVGAEEQEEDDEKWLEEMRPFFRKVKA